MPSLEIRFLALWPPFDEGIATLVLMRLPLLVMDAKSESMERGAVSGESSSDPDDDTESVYVDVERGPCACVAPLENPPPTVSGWGAVARSNEGVRRRAAEEEDQLVTSAPSAPAQTPRAAAPVTLSVKVAGAVQRPVRIAATSTPSLSDDRAAKGDASGICAAARRASMPCALPQTPTLLLLLLHPASAAPPLTNVVSDDVAALVSTSSSSMVTARPRLGGADADRDRDGTAATKSDPSSSPTSASKRSLGLAPRALYAAVPLSERLPTAASYSSSSDTISSESVPV